MNRNPRESLTTRVLRGEHPVKVLLEDLRRSGFLRQEFTYPGDDQYKFSGDPDQLSQSDWDAQDDEEIRPYGPGKFNSIVDQFVYGADADEQAGDSSEGLGWVALYRGAFDDEYIKMLEGDLRETLNAAERRLLTTMVGAILLEQTSGFVHVTYFEPGEDLEAAWKEAEEEYGWDSEEGPNWNTQDDERFDADH